jgi:radical SAM superfamily enzyme
MEERHGIIFTGMERTKTISRPAGAARMRTFLEKHDFNIEVVDYFGNFTEQELELLCKRFIGPKTLFVGISITFVYAFDKINYLFDHIKNNYPHVKTLIGGNETPIDGVDLTKVDRIFWGYSEEALLHYLKFLTKKRLDDLPWIPYRETFSVNAEMLYKNDSSDLTIKWLESDLIKHNFLPIEISRGCIFRCRFCAFPLLGKKKNDYIRHVDNLSDEFRRNYEMFGVTNYWFNDDTFNDNVVKLEYVAEAIAKSGVKITYTAFLRADLIQRFPETIPMLGDTGLVAATFGLETLHPEAKKAIGKGLDNERQFEAIRQLKKYKPVYTYTGMICGLPGEPVSSVIKSQKTLISQNFEVFDNWDWWPLLIRKDSISRLSEFEREYEKWGYTEMLPEEYNVVNRDDDFRYAQADKGIMIWKNQYTNWYVARSVANVLNRETEEHRRKAGKSIYGNADKGVSINHDVYELVGLGVDIKDIISGNFDKKFLYNKVKESEQTILEYKKLKLGL